MITPSFGLTATERVLPKLALDFTTAFLDARVTFSRTGATATRFNSSGFIELVAADTPRFDFDPITFVCKGLLIEESRTNLITYSEDIDNANWLKIRTTVLSNVVASPDGSTNADKIVETTQTAFDRYAAQDFSSLNGLYSFSVFLKKAGNDYVQLAYIDNGVIFRPSFDLANGTILSTGDSQVFIKDVGNGWWHCGWSKNCTALTQIQIITQKFATRQSYTGDGVSGVYAWGAQLEAGAFATSYIPTEASAVTRNADVATMTGTNFSDWFNASEGTLYVKGERFGTSSNFPRMVSVNDGSTANEIYATVFGSANQAVTGVVSGGVGQASMSPVTIGAGNTAQIALAYKLNSANTAIDGVAQATDNSVALPASISQMNIGRRPAGEFLNGYIQQIKYWDIRMLNAETAAFTK